jgi:hypothetical protein
VSAPDLPRFKVASVTGWGAGGTALTTSYSVLDTWNCHQIVSAFYTPTQGSGRPIPRDVLAPSRRTGRPLCPLSEHSAHGGSRATLVDVSLVQTPEPAANVGVR